jgi:hypothetical protein
MDETAPRPVLALFLAQGRESTTLNTILCFVELSFSFLSRPPFPHYCDCEATEAMYASTLLLSTLVRIHIRKVF